MILDSRLEFCDATALNTGGAASYIIGSQVDLGAASRDIGNGEPMYLIITVDTAVDSSADNTTQAFALVSDSVVTLDSSVTVHCTTGTQTQATLVAGKTFVLPLPQGITYERYLGIQQTTGTAAATAGKINAFLTTDPTGWVAYSDFT